MPVKNGQNALSTAMLKNWSSIEPAPRMENTYKVNPVASALCNCCGSSRRKLLDVVIANGKRITTPKPLHQRQIPAGAGLIVNNKSPIMQSARGKIELIRSNRRRNLSIGDQS